MSDQFVGGGTCRRHLHDWACTRCGRLCIWWLKTSVAVAQQHPVSTYHHADLYLQRSVVYQLRLGQHAFKHRNPPEKFHQTWRAGSARLQSMPDTTASNTVLRIPHTASFINSAPSFPTARSRKRADPICTSGKSSTTILPRGLPAKRTQATFSFKEH